MPRVGLENIRNLGPQDSVRVSSINFLSPESLSALIQTTVDGRDFSLHVQVRRAQSSGSSPVDLEALSLQEYVRVLQRAIELAEEELKSRS